MFVLVMLVVVAAVVYLVVKADSEPTFADAVRGATKPETQPAASSGEQPTGPKDTEQA